MRSAKKILIRTFVALLSVYVLICLGVYFFQERMLFLPEKLDKNYRFSFAQPFEEINVETRNGDSLNGLLFTTDSARGLVFYLHGNAGSLKKWGGVAKRYTDLHYDIFIPDYPGYGKSSGSIKSSAQLLEGIQAVYDKMKKRYSEKQIVILGYSIGSGPAAYLASANHPRLLILQAPYYSLTDMMRHDYPIIPSFLLRYNFPTSEYLKICKPPVVIFHGNLDDVIYYGSSLKLEKEMKRGDTLITLQGEKHNNMTDYPSYIKAIKEVLK